jgi:hypothetical protein
MERMEVTMRRGFLLNVGLVALTAVLFAIVVGCQDNSVANNSAADFAGLNSGEADLGSASTAQFDFSVRGYIERIDEDQRVIRLAGDDFSNEPLTLTVGKEATLLFEPSQITIPFTFKYLEAGDLVVISGQRSGEERIGELFRLYDDEVPVVGNDDPMLTETDQEADGNVRYAGDIVKIDIDARVIQLEGADLSGVERTFYIDRDAVLRTLPSRNEFPFKFEYIETGSFIVIYGQPRADAPVLAEVIELDQEIGPIENDGQPSLTESATDEGIAADFRLQGEVDKFDEDMRVIEFAGGDLGGQNPTVLIDRAATMRLLPDQNDIPFNFKFIEAGTVLTVLGDVREDGARVATLVEVHRDVTTPATAGASL